MPRPHAAQPPGSWYNPRSVGRSLALRPKVYVSALVGTATYLLLPDSVSRSFGFTISWDIAALIYLAFALHVMWRTDAGRLRELAARQDDGAVAILILIVVAVAASLFAVVGVAGEVARSHNGAALQLFLVVAAVIAAWLVVQVAFAMHYAHEHYDPDNLARKAGLSFPGEDEPDYWDFLYFAISFGAAFQTSEVQIKARPLRRLATAHATLAFFYNAAVIALSVSVISDLIKR